MVVPQTWDLLLPSLPWFQGRNPQGYLVYLHPPLLGTRTPGWSWAIDLTVTLTSCVPYLLQLSPFPTCSLWAFSL